MAEQEQSVLTLDQKARGQALIIARDILAAKGGGPFSSVSLANGDPEPVIRLAEYVLNGYVVTFSDGDDQSVGEASESDMSYEWTGAANDSESQPAPSPRGGSVVRLTFDDGSRRLFMDTGRDYFSPPVVGTFETAMVAEYDSPSIKGIEFLLEMGPTL